jgi:5-methylcytosine-specific restriction endonuclease McrA
MANFTESKINEVWNKGKKVDGVPDKYRQDFAGAWMEKEKYGKEESFGWEIDHKVPASKGGTDELENLQPLQWENNRTKADNYPKFKTSVSSNGDNYLRKEKPWEYK